MITITLSGYPEALLGRPAITAPFPSGAVLADAVTAVAAQDVRLGTALLHSDARPRQSTKVLLNGAVTSLDTRIPADAQVTVLAALPCDG